MTSQVKGVIRYNHPVVVERVDGNLNSEVLFKSTGQPTEFHAEETLEIDYWFSGDQKIVISEQK